MKKDIIQETGAESVFDIAPNIGSQTPNEALKELDTQIDLFEDNTDPNFSDPIPEEEEEEDETGEETEEESEGEEEEESDINVLPLLVNTMKSRGFLPAEVVTEDIKTEDDLMSAYENKISQEVTNSVVSDLEQKLKDRGVTEYHLDLALKLANGISNEELSTFDKYKNLSSAKTEEYTTDQAVKYCENYLLETGASKVVIKNTISTIEVDDEALTELLADAKQFYSTKRDSIKQDQDRIAQEQLAAKEEFNRKQTDIMLKVLNEGKVRGEQIPDTTKFKRLVNTYDTTVNIGGRDYPTSAYGKFLADFQTDPELKLWAFKQFVFQDEIKETIKQEAAEKAETNLLSGFKSIRVKDSKKVNKVTNKKETTGKTYLMSSSGFIQKT